MINILNKRTAKKQSQRQMIQFSSSYINKFELALRNFDIFVKEESKRGFRNNYR